MATMTTRAVIVRGPGWWELTELELDEPKAPEVRIRFGSCNPLYHIPRLLDLYRAGDLKLDELITRRYTLDEVNQGYRGMLDGKTVRSVIIHEH